MKVLRIIFYALMPVFLVAGLYTGMRLWFVLLIAQVLLLLFIFGLNQWTLRTFAYTQSLDATEAVKGSETTLHLSIRNEKPFPLSMMKVDVEMAAPSENTDVSFSLLPFTGKEFDFRVAMPYRGVYPIGVTTMRITDIFGLLPTRFDMRKLKYYRQPELTVYPRAEAPESLYGGREAVRGALPSLLREREQHLRGPGLPPRGPAEADPLEKERPARGAVRQAV